MTEKNVNFSVYYLPAISCKYLGTAFASKGCEKFHLTIPPSPRKQKVSLKLAYFSFSEFKDSNNSGEAYPKNCFVCPNWFSLTFMTNMCMPISSQRLTLFLKASM